MMKTSIKRTYSNFTGVDFLNESSIVNITRSPDALNVWKNYEDNEGTCIETRPGCNKIATIGTRINGMYLFSDNKAIVHSGTCLYEWINFPETPEAEDIVLLSNEMNNSKSCFNMFKGSLYINDGSKYLVYDGTTLKEASEDAYIPTTTINRTPSGGGEMYNDVNVLQPQRRNMFWGDGVAKDYYLDTQNIDEVTKVIVDDVEVTDYTVDLEKGKITFTTAPSKPVMSDNVEIVFKKTIEGYIDRIGKCTKAIQFDNRIFYTGNPDFKNAIFWCELNNPLYISDLNYIEDGSSDSAITGMTVGNNILWVFKDGDQNNANVFYHEAVLSDEKIYPSKKGNVSTGCYAGSYNFQDDIVYLSRHGLEGIVTSDLDNRQVISHRSSLIDTKMINSSNYKKAEIAEYRGYLLILVDGKIYLADSRQKYASLQSFEYEWFYWDISVVNPTILKEYNNKLYIGASDGSIFVLEGTNDNGEIIQSYWTTPMDNFGYLNQLKTTNKRGGLAKIKKIPHGEIKVARKTNKADEYKYTNQKSLSGFSFNDFSFNSLTFSTTNKTYMLYKIKEKKINELSLKFYSDELDKPFGFFSATIEAFVGGYVKK